MEMNSHRTLGQILLWTGFLSAAIAACAQKEFDLLPETERQSLSKLVSGVSITRSELAPYTGKELKSLSARELADVCSGIAPVMKQRSDFQEKFNELTEGDINDLSPDQLDDYAILVLPALKAAAAQRKKDEMKEKGAEKEETTEKSFNKKDFVAARTSLIEDKWGTVNWLWYLASMAVGLGGVVLLRRSSKSAITDSGRVAKEYTAITENLASLRQHVGILKSNLTDMTPQDIVRYIDENCGKPFADFADARNSLVQRFGLSAFAEVMTQFASGERFLNRAWSAAADGYINEVKDCVNRSDAHLARADDIIAEYEQSI